MTWRDCYRMIAVFCIKGVPRSVLRRVRFFAHMKISSRYFSPEDTFECGQCFRWQKKDDGTYIGVVDHAVVEVSPMGTDYELSVVAGEIAEDRLMHYFDLETDYAPICDYLRVKDDWLKRSIESGSGIRILNQDPFETLISFAISANNNIPKIKMAIEALSETLGTEIGTVADKVYYAFPTVEQIREANEAALKVRGMGYRFKAVGEIAHRISEQHLDLNHPFLIEDSEGIEWLKQFYGVGDKVASCVLLFAYGKRDAFPIDTWVKRLLRELYGVDDTTGAYASFVEQYFDLYGGYAQQYLFHYMRNIKKKG